MGRNNIKLAWLLLSFFSSALFAVATKNEDEEVVTLHWNFDEDRDIKVTHRSQVHHVPAGGHINATVPIMDNRDLVAFYDALKQKWMMEDPVYFFCDDSAAFIMRFTVSDYITGT